MNDMDLSRKTEDEVQEVIAENSDGKEQKSKKALRDLLVVILLFAAFPIVLRGGGAILGIVLAIMVVIAGVVMLPFSATLGLLFAGGLELFLGIRSFSQNGADSLSTVGLGALLLGLGVAALFLSIKFYKKSIPWIIKKIKGGSDRVKAFADKNGKI